MEHLSADGSCGTQHGKRQENPEHQQEEEKIVEEEQNINSHLSPEQIEKTLDREKSVTEKVPKEDNDFEDIHNNNTCNEENKVGEECVSERENEKEADNEGDVNSSRQLVSDKEESEAKLDEFLSQKSLHESQTAEGVEGQASVGDIQAQSIVCGDASVIMSVDVQAGPQETSQHMKPDEHHSEGSDGGNGESSVSTLKDRYGAVEEDVKETDQAQTLTESRPDVGDQNQAVVGDTEIENVTVLLGNEVRDSKVSYFPALDNVDLETDEEGQEGDNVPREEEHDDDGSDLGSDNKLDEGLLDEEVTGHIFRTDESRHKSEELSPRHHETLVEPVPYVNIDGGGSSSRISNLASTGSLHKDYPLNYQNYKVCREVSPGIKECLILETGEQFLCVSETKTQPAETSDLHPDEMGMDSFGQTSGSSYSHDKAVNVGVNNIESSTTTGTLADHFKTYERASSSDSVVHLDNTHQEFISVKGIPVTDDENLREVMKGSKKHIIEDDLSSGGESEIRSLHSSMEKEDFLKKSKREKQNGFIELQPEIDGDNVEEIAVESGINVNNNSNQKVLESEANTNENASSNHNMERELKRGVPITSSHYPSDRSYRTENSDHSHSYDRHMTSSRALNMPGLKSFSQTTSRDSSLYGSRGHRSQEDIPLYMSKKPSSSDTSHISTRYTHIERGDTRKSPSQPESVTVPKFNTLKDQQVSWLDMFKMIEKQHRTELQTQYLEHQMILQDMQKNMERELIKQQDTLRQRLCRHKEILDELSPSHQEDRNVNKSLTRHAGDVSNIDRQRFSEYIPTSNTSNITLQGVPVALRNPPPALHHYYDSKSPTDLPVKRSLESEFSSPIRPADTSLSQPSRVAIDRNKQLRGGVYSSPLPIAKVRQKKSARGSKSNENTNRGSRQEIYHNNSVHYDLQPRDGQDHELASTSLTESDDVLSPRTRNSVREKHAKHIADLQAYCDKEMRELMQSRRARGDTDSLLQGPTAEEQILANENQELRKKCKQLQESYHDANIVIRELQQKMQGLEIRAADYADRYKAAQSQVLSLKSSLEELTDFAKEKESTITDLESKNRKNSDSLQLAYRKEQELADSLHNAKSTIQKLVEQYEALEKDYNITKETLKETQEKLFNSRTEVMEANSKLSRLELENKQLKHDIENLRRDLTMARSSITMHTSYEDAYNKPGNFDQAQQNYSFSHSARSRSMDRNRSYVSHSVHPQDSKSETSSEAESDRDYLKSPILKAERELKKLQQSPEFTPKLQRKFYGSEVPSSFSGSPITVNHTSGVTFRSPTTSKSQPPRDKKTWTPVKVREGRSSAPSNFSRAQRERPKSDQVLNEKVSARRGYQDTESSRSNIVSPERVKGNERVDRLANSAKVGTKSIQWDSQEVLNQLRNESRKLLEFRKYQHLERLQEKEMQFGSESSTSANGLTSDQAVERIKSGEIVSRPAWEDVYTSLASGRPGSSNLKVSPSNYARDQMIRERLQNIENMEKKYDNLSNEKRKYEAALSKLPVQGHGRERDRLEAELDRVDQELGSVRMSLKRYHVLKSSR